MTRQLFSVGTRFEHNATMWTVRRITTLLNSPLVVLEADDGDLIDMALDEALRAAHDYFTVPELGRALARDDLHDCTPKQREIAHERATFVRLIIDGAASVSFGSGSVDRYDSSRTTRAQRLNQLVDDLKQLGQQGYSRASLYRLSKSFEVERNIRVLIPYMGTRRAPDPRDSIPDEHIDAIYRSLTALKPPGIPKLALDIRVSKAVKGMQDAGLDVHLISPYTLERAVKLISVELGLEKTSKQRKSESSRAITGHRSPPPMIPGQRVEIDSTQADIWLMCEETRERFRPWIIVLVCVVTRLVVVRVTRERPTSADWRLTLFAGMRPLVSDWAVEEFTVPFGVPAAVCIAVAPNGYGTVVSDHGGDIENYRLADSVARWGGEVEWAATRTGSHKAYVENANGVLNRFLQYARGYSGGSVENKADADAIPTHELLTLRQFRALMSVWCHKIRPFTPHEGLPTKQGKFMSPADKFTQCVARGFGPRVDVHPDDVYGLLDTTELALGADGVHKRPFRYDSPYLKSYQSYVQDSRGRLPMSVRVFFDRNDLSRMFFRDPREGCWHALRAVAHDGTSLDPFSDLISSDVAELMGRPMWTRGERIDVGLAVHDLLTAIKNKHPSKYSKDRSRVQSALPDPTGQPHSAPVDDARPHDEAEFPVDIERFVIRDIPDIGDDLW